MDSSDALFCFDSADLEYIDKVITERKPSSRRNKGALKRPRVPKEFTTTLFEVVPPSSPTDRRTNKITTAENTATVARMQKLTQELIACGLWQQYLLVQGPHPTRIKYSIDRPKDQSRLNRKSMERYKKDLYAWNVAQCEAMQGMLLDFSNAA
jgi:hypothetical protein